ncbi:hypothetical protein KA005_38130 [bacterium]|nr:hypothetical protein [bacterium]
MKELVEHLTKHVQKELNALSDSDWKVTYELEHLDFCFVAETKLPNGERYAVKSRSYDPRNINDIGIAGIILQAATMIHVHYDENAKAMAGDRTV